MKGITSDPQWRSYAGQAICLVVSQDFPGELKQLILHICRMVDGEMTTRLFHRPPKL
jgi:hypothetical protein